MPTTACGPDNFVDTLSYTPDNKTEASAAIKTTLYDLLAAIHDTVGPEDDQLAVAVAVHLLQSGRVTLLGDAEVFTAWDPEASLSAARPEPSPALHGVGDARP
jgi:hypothetical protein